MDDLEREEVEPTDIILDPSQQVAVDMMCSKRLGIVTGGPGTGKSTIVRKVLDRLPTKEHVALCAPTGKAAKRITEVTGYPAMTVHRLLGAQNGDNGWIFESDATNPLPHHVLIVDEASMLDAEMAHHLMAAINPLRTRVFFVGDADQLPSVGPGQVFADMISSGAFPTVHLTQVHRSALKSWVCRNAPLILEGDIDILTKCDDFRYYPRNDSERLAKDLVSLVADKMPEAGVQDIQVLTPQNGGAIGVEMLNNYLQSRLNPLKGNAPTWPVRAPKGATYVFSEGDRVLATENDYERTVFNGEIGTIKRIDLDRNVMCVLFDGREVEYDHSNAHTLRLAYALTIHKCVSPDTLVETERGLQPIKNIPRAGMIGTVEGMLPYTGFVAYTERDMITLRTRHGYEITVTSDHGMMTWDGKQYVRREAKDLVLGDILRLRLDASSSVFTEVALPGAPAVDVRAKIYTLPKVLTSEVAELFGLLVADGTVYKSGFRLKKRHKDVCDRVVELCAALFGTDIDTKEDVNCWNAEINSSFLSAWLLQIGGLGPKAKAVPSLILQSPLHVQAAFLRGLFEDGGVNMREGGIDHIEWSTSYEEMSRVVQVMLLHQGIISSRFSNARLWRIDVYGGQIRRFKERVGFVSGKKCLLLDAPIGEDLKKFVPVDKEWVRTAIPRNEETVYDRQNALSRGRVSRAVAAKWGIDLSFHHDEIASIEHSTGPAMCVSVPHHGRFIQNGFDGCNSQGSEWGWVVVVCHGSHAYMWSRQLLYTAVTRAKKGVILIGDAEGLGAALLNNQPRQRRTTLVDNIAALQKLPSP